MNVVPSLGSVLPAPAARSTPATVADPDHVQPGIQPDSTRFNQAFNQIQPGIQPDSTAAGRAGPCEIADPVLLDDAAVILFLTPVCVVFSS